MSLHHHLGLSMFHRQFYYPLSPSTSDVRSPDSDSSSQDAQDNKDVLIQRLNDLVEELSHDDMVDSTITALHKKTDEMEILLKTNKTNPSSSFLNERVDSLSRRDSDDVFWGRPETPTRSFLPWSTPPPSRPRTAPREKSIYSSKVAEIAASVDDLNVRLVKAVRQLQASRKESNRIITWHFDQLEAKKRETETMKAHVANLEKKLEVKESLVNYLRIEMKAISAKHAKSLDDESSDDELEESICNWRRDWDDLNKEKETKSEGDTKEQDPETPGLIGGMRRLSLA